MSVSSDLLPRLEFALDLARKAGETVLEHFQTDLAVDRKGDDSPVTAADRAAEKLMRAAIEEAFPEDGVLGEEFGETRPGAAGRWILDPIDGTRSFARGSPLFGVLIAFEAGGRSELGVLHFPALAETVHAGRGLGCFWNGAEARVSEVDRLSEALITTTTVEGLVRAGFGDRWIRLAERVSPPDAKTSPRGMVRTWGDCHGYALVATGRAEVMVDPRMALWDVAPLVPVIEEAGGVITDWSGRSGHAVTNAIATNAKLAKAVREILVSSPAS